MRFSRAFNGRVEEKSDRRKKPITKSVRFNVPDTAYRMDYEGVNSIANGTSSHIDPHQMMEVLRSIEIQKRTESNESPTSVRDGIGEVDSSEISCTDENEESWNDGPRCHSYIFATIDRILIGIIEEETGGVEVDEFGPDPFDSIVRPISMMSTSDDGLGQQVTIEDPMAAPSDDIRMFSMGLVGHGHRSIPATIVKNSLERHMESVLLTWMKKQSISPNMTEREQIEMLAFETIQQKNYGKAISLYRVLEQSKERRTQGEVTRTLANLIVLNTLVGKERSSMVYAKRSLRIHRQEMNKYEASMSLFLLGVVYFRFGRIEKAFKTWREALQILILVFGYDHAYVAMLLNNLGCLHYVQGDFVKSLQLFSESMDIDRVVLSSSTWDAEATILDISLTKGNIAMILARNGKFEASWSLLEEALSLQECLSHEKAQRLVTETQMAMKRVDDRIVTTSTISTAASTNFFGSKSELSDHAANHTVDTFTHIHVEETRTSIFGSGDGIPMRRNSSKSPIDVIDGSDNLDTILLGSLENEYTPKQRVRAAMLCWFDKTLLDEERDPRLPFVAFQTTPRKRARIPIDLDTNEAINAELHLKEIIEQAVDYLEHDEYEEALDLFESSLYSHREKYGEAHHLVGTAIHNIGMVHLYAQNYPQALKHFQEAVSVRRVALGPDHPAIAASLLKIGMLFLVQSNPEGAKEAFSRAMKIIKKSIGNESIQMARVLTNMGVAQYESGSLIEASKSFNEARCIQEKLLQMAQSENVFLQPQRRTIELALINSLCNIGFLQCRFKDYKESLKSYQEAKRLRRQHASTLQPDVYCLEENLSFVGERVRELEMRETTESEDNKRNQSPLDSFLEALMDKIKCSS